MPPITRAYTTACVLTTVAVVSYGKTVASLMEYLLSCIIAQHHVNKACQFQNLWCLADVSFAMRNHFVAGRRILMLHFIKKLNFVDLYFIIWAVHWILADKLFSVLTVVYKWWDSGSLTELCAVIFFQQLDVITPFQLYFNPDLIFRSYQVIKCWNGCLALHDSIYIVARFN